MSTIELEPARPADNRVPWFAVISFYVLASGLAWLIASPLWIRGHGLADPLLPILTAGMMFTPTVAMIICVAVIQRPRPRPVLAYLGIWPLRPVKRVIALALVGMFAPALMVIAGTFLAAAFGTLRLDLTHFSGLAEYLTALGRPPTQPLGTVVLAQLVSIPIATIFPNALLTLGEELGWRGYLLPSLRPLGTWPALLVSGAAWGLWHSPLILLGYNFARPNLFGVVLMIIACMVIGTFIGWLRLRSGSVWPSVLAHASLNAAASFAILVMASGQTLDTAKAGPLGWSAWIVVAVVVAVLVVTGQFRRQPGLRRRVEADAPREAQPVAGR